jgi:hypothetical protein
MDWINIFYALLEGVGAFVLLIIFFVMTLWIYAANSPDCSDDDSEMDTK